MKINLFLISVLFFTNFLSQSNLFKISGEAQGTTYCIIYWDSLNRNLETEIDQLLYDFEQSVSTYKPNSIISKINRNDTTALIDVYFETCFLKAKKAWKETKGSFDPTVYPLVNAWGFGPEKKQMVTKHMIDSLKQFVGFEKIHLINGKIEKQDPRVCLDFNAFAQGYSVDVVSNFLFARNINNYLVEIGGEVKASGKKSNHEFWKIGIEQPVENSAGQNPLTALVELNDIAIATSGNYRKYFIENGQKIVHHIDPETGYSTANNLLSASVFSSECVYSDAYATGLLVMGLKKAKRFLKKHKEIKAYFIYTDKKGNFCTFKSKGLEIEVIH